MVTLVEMIICCLMMGDGHDDCHCCYVYVLDDHDHDHGKGVGDKCVVIDDRYKCASEDHHSLDVHHDDIV